MTIDRTAAARTFNAYVADYDPKNPRIALKVAHTLRVAALADDIARATGPENPNLTKEQVDLCWLTGLVHDIGRFEQVRRFDTFNDAQSVPHAALGAEILFDGPAPLIRSFTDDEGTYPLIKTVVATHADFRLPEDLDPLTRCVVDVLRDADKLDILAVNCTSPIEDIYAVTDADMDASALSDAVEEAFWRHETVLRSVRRHPADILVGHVCFAWELVFARSRKICAEQGHLDHMLSRRFLDLEVDARFRRMAAHMRECLGLR